MGDGRDLASLAVPAAGELIAVNDRYEPFRMTGPDGYKALADPTRRQILKLLREGELPAGSTAKEVAASIMPIIAGVEKTGGSRGS